MSRLSSMFMLWVLLLLAAAPASAVMDVQPRNHTWELPASSYDLAPDVRDGPNLYAYVMQNPWSGFDPDGLETTKAGATVTRDKHHVSPVSTWDENGFSKDVQTELNKHRIGKDDVPHGAAGHDQYTKRVDAITKEYTGKAGVKPGGLSGKDAKAFADGLIKEIEMTQDAYVRGFNDLVKGGANQNQLKLFGREYKAGVVAGRFKDVWFRGANQFMVKGGHVMNGAAKAFGYVGRKLPGALKVVAAGAAYSEFTGDVQAGESASEAARTQFYRFGSLTGDTPEERRAKDHNFSESFFNVISTGNWETNSEREERETSKK